MRHLALYYPDKLYHKVCNIVETVKAAILANSYAMIVAHNHPAGSLTASEEDIETTRTLIKAGRLLGISVIDHVIVASKGINSLREEKPELWIE